MIALRPKNIYNDAVIGNPYPLIFDPNYFAPLPEIWHKDADVEEEIMTWYNRYSTRPNIEHIKKQLMPIA